MICLPSCATRVVARPNHVTVVKTPPKHYKTVKVRGQRYYKWNGNHYRKANCGYVVVHL